MRRITAIILLLVTAVPLTGAAKFFTGDLNYNGFVDDYRGYTSRNKQWHAGHPYDHGKWTANIIEDWFTTNHYWTRGLSKKDLGLAVLAGFMHDIGKAGDTATPFLWKIDHPQDGFNYLLGTKTYQTLQGKDFNFSDYFRQLGIGKEEQKMIAIITGIHYDFGVIVLSGLAQGKSAERLSQLYLKKLEKLCKEADYNGGIVNRRLLMLAMIVSVADIKANTPFPYKSLVLGSLPVARAAYNSSIMNSYVKFNVEEAGKKARAMLLHYFDSQYKPSATLGDVTHLIKRLSHNRHLRRQFSPLHTKLYA